MPDPAHDSSLSGPQSYCENFHIIIFLIYINTSETTSSTICHTNVASNDIHHAYYTFLLIKKLLQKYNVGLFPAQQNMHNPLIWP
jgi:hypothetical protein